MERDTCRFRLGFVEVAAKGGREEWFDVQAPPVGTCVRYAASPHLPPLVRVLDQAPKAGIVALSNDYIETYEWYFGTLSPIDSFELEYFGDDWRERKAKLADVSHGTTTSASGRDQFDQRMDENRNRYLTQSGYEVSKLKRKREWDIVICFGPEICHHHFVKNYPEDPPRLVGSADLVHHPIQDVADHANRCIAEIEAEREAELVRRATELTYNGRAALGVQQILECLEMARVEHLVYNAAREFDDQLEELVGRAISTGASVTPVEGGRAEPLAEHDGVAAILRY
jgi:hypothetical protein